MTNSVIQEIIEDLEKIPKRINSTIDINDIADAVSKKLNRQLRGRVSI